ncbi:hypothetical protein L596_025268 [Steinernema carpocapsae]|uniref:Uncharacterized protein n=1 Tax=Steinernema carpocapsae TaxID=34508 RepID=A0A4U5M7A4_STECR|nr:hypothetical protein L596_025268 [Steinernema carpocapsae]
MLTMFQPSSLMFQSTNVAIVLTSLFLHAGSSRPTVLMWAFKRLVSILRSELLAHYYAILEISDIPGSS